MGRRAAVLAVGAVGAVAVLAAAPAAQASFHLTKVSEVLTSNGGDGAQQFVELQDPAEPFPDLDAPYKLKVFDAAGAVVGAQTLSAAMLRTVAALRPILISTAAYDAAAGTSGDAVLTVSLPSDAGQACFTARSSDIRVHCMSWGTIATPLSGSGGRTAGAAPGDGQSLQTQCDGTAALAPPTPAASNDEVVAACVDQPPVVTVGGGGGSGGGGSGGGATGGGATGGGGTSGGGTGGGGGGAGSPAAREVVSHLRIGARWRLGRALPAYDAARAVGVGTTIGFSLSRAGTVQLEFLRSEPGRAVGGRCVAQTHANGHERRCVRQVVRGRLSHRAHAGASRLRFEGRLSPRRTLTPGRYTLRVTATDGSGSRSAPKTAVFTVLAAR